MTRLSKMLRQKGMTAYQLAKQTGIPTRTCYFYADGTKPLKKANYIYVKAIADALDCTVDELMEG